MTAAEQLHGEACGCLWCRDADERHDAGCECEECRPCCAEATCREHASEAEIEERAAAAYARMHGVTL